MRIRRRLLDLALIALLFVQAPGLLAQGERSWVSTWASAPQQWRAPRNGPVPNENGALEDQTIRMIVRTSIGGSRVRVWLSNAYGTEALEVGAARIAVAENGSMIVPGTERALTFSGRASVMIPPGAPMVSDPVDLEVGALADLAVSLYLPEKTGSPTMHSMGLRPAYISGTGNFVAASEINESSTVSSWYWLSGVDVLAPEGAGTVVAFGDSITDGATSTPETDRSWPSVLANRLAENDATREIGVVNLGISGNRLLSDGAGVSALARFDRDVLSRPGVRWVMILEGINDIGATARGDAPGVSAGTLIGALTQMAARAHAHGIQVIGCTLTPYGGAGYFSEAGEVMRQAVNDFIRTSGVFDQVVDFDAVTRDPADPLRFRSGFNNGDNLHPNDAGYRAMAESVDLSIFND